MFLPASTRSSEKELTVPTSFGFLPGGRSSSSTILPPSYESASMVSSPFAHDKKRSSLEGELYHSQVRYHVPAIQTGVKQVYVDYPLAFCRAPAVTNRILTPFDPLTVPIEGSGRSLDKGFSLDLPPTSENIHPFAKRDIKASDWVRFMQDLRNGTAMSKCTKQKTLLIPLALGLGPGAFFISKAVKAQIRRKKLAYAINLIDTWNQYFFNPRSTEVILMRGSHPLTMSRFTAHQGNPGRDFECGDPVWVPGSAYYDSGDCPVQAEKSTGCCSQSGAPMRLVVVSI